MTTEQSFLKYFFNMPSIHLFITTLLSTVCLVIIPQALAVLDNGSSPCSILESLLQNKVSYPNDTTYKTSILSYFFREARLSPTCIVKPTSASDVSVIVNTMVGARNHSSNSSAFAIRSGGHTPFAGAANINNGVTIDLRAMDSVNVSSDQTITSVGAGSIWKNIYEELQLMNLTVLGARVAGLGVGGLITGGQLVPLTILLRRDK